MFSASNVSKRFMSLTGQETFHTIAVAAVAASVASPRQVNSVDLEVVKQELIVEVRREIQMAKQEILEGAILVYDINIIQIGPQSYRYLYSTQ